MVSRFNPSADGPGFVLVGLPAPTARQPHPRPREHKAGQSRKKGRNSCANSCEEVIYWRLEPRGRLANSTDRGTLRCASFSKLYTRMCSECASVSMLLTTDSPYIGVPDDGGSEVVPMIPGGVHKRPADLPVGASEMSTTPVTWQKPANLPITMICDSG